MRWSAAIHYPVAIGGAFLAGCVTPPIAPKAKTDDRPPVSAVIEEMQRFGRLGSFQLSQQLDKRIASLDEAEVKTALDSTASMAGERARSLFRGRLLNRWAEINPKEALAWAERLTDTREREGAIRAVTWTWAATAPDGVLAWARSQPDSFERDAAMTSYFRDTATSDPDTALKVLRSWDPPDQMADFVRDLFSALADRDPAAAIREAADIKGRKLSLAYEGITTTWAQADPRATAAWIETLPPTSSNISGLRGIVVWAWAQQDPAAAAEYANSQQMANYSVNVVVARWADQNLEAALTWTENLRNSDAQRQAFSGLMPNLLKNPAGALDRVAKSSPPSLRASLRHDILSQWAMTNGAAALAYARAVADASQRDTDLLTVLNSMQKPTDALVALNDLQPGPSRTQFGATLASRLTRTDPDAAYAFVQSYPAGDERNVMVRGAALTLATSYRDFKTALKFVELLPPGPLRDSVTQSIASAAANGPSSGPIRPVDPFNMISD